MRTKIWLFRERESAGIVSVGGIVPRPDKKITPGGLHSASSSRGQSWTKYGSIETADLHEGVPSEITVDLTDDPGDTARSADSSKYVERSFAAPLPPLPDDEQDQQGEDVSAGMVVETEWSSVRVIEDRTYRRHDELVSRTVEA